LSPSLSRNELVEPARSWAAEFVVATGWVGCCVTTTRRR